MENDTTDFGFSEVPLADKARRVRAVFDSVAGRYDVMNDLMSLGLHRVWKRFAVGLVAAQPGERILDLAGLVLLGDINGAMLARGRERLLDAGIAGNVDYLQLDAERLPLAERSLDCVIIGFGLRNVTDKQAALVEMHRVLKPGGRALVLEFSRPVLPPLKPVYDAYSFQVLPRLGRLVAGDADSYRYLAESIRRHPDQDTLLGMLHVAGFARCQYFNLTGGIVAVHRGYRL